MCTNCIVSNHATCHFNGWGENCDSCKLGKRPKCSFKVSAAQRVATADLLAAAVPSSQFGKSVSFYPSFVPS